MEMKDKSLSAPHVIQDTTSMAIFVNLATDGEEKKDAASVKKCRILSIPISDGSTVSSVILTSCSSSLMSHLEDLSI